MAQEDKQLPLEDGPWDEMRDSISATAKSTGKYLLGQNIYPLDPDLGETMVGRPGVRQMGAQLAGRGQGTYQFKKTTGARFTVQIAGGHFYTLDWAAEAWVEVLSAANLLAAGVVLDANRQIAFLTTSTDRLLVSDGINKPWLWDGTAGGGVTLMANAEAFFGQPRMYFARVVGILAADPSTIIWSETDNPLVGYRAGGFNNAWKPSQNDPSRLYSLVATNNVIYAFRANSALPLAGPPGPGFSTDNTQDSLSGTFGSLSPFASILHDVNVVTLDSQLHPQFFRPGGAGFVPIWRGLRETTKRIPKDPETALKCMIVYYSPAELFLIAVPEQGGECNILLVYDAKGELPKPVGVWRGWEMTTLAMVENLNGQAYLFHSDTTGRVYLHGNPDDFTPWDDFLAAGTAPVEHILECQPLGYSTKLEKIYDRIDLAFRGLSTMTLQVSVTTPEGVSPEQQIVVGTGGTPAFDVGLFDVVTFDPSGGTTQETHAELGLDAEGRWIKPKIRHKMLGEQFGIAALTVEAYTFDDDPEEP